MPEYLIFANDEWVTETNDEGWRQRSRDLRAVVEEMKAAGVYLFLGGLDNDARVFHVEPGGGTPIITDGPYAETKEVIGGFAVIDVPDEAAARYWAGRVAVACDWPHEVRIFQKPPAEITSLDADNAADAAREADET
jgi:hypothetical protein